MAHYLFNHVGDDAHELMRAGTWVIGPDEPHRDALASGDLVLIYAAGPRVFLGRAELTSSWHTTGVSLAHVDEWDPPVPMDAVLAQIPPTENAKGDFAVGVVGITEVEYDAALQVASQLRR